jgi:hypothetical protein
MEAKNKQRFLLAACLPYSKDGGRVLKIVDEPLVDHISEDNQFWENLKSNIL